MLRFFQCGCKPVDRATKPFTKRYTRLPTEKFPRARNVGTPPGRVILGQRMINDLGAGRHHVNDHFGELIDRELSRISDIDWHLRIFRRIHERCQPSHKVADIAKGPRLLAAPINGQRLAGNCLNDKIGYDPTVCGLHARAVSVENPDHPRIHAMSTQEVEAKRFSRPFSFIVASAGPGAIDIAPVVLPLRMQGCKSGRQAIAPSGQPTAAEITLKKFVRHRDFFWAN